MAVCVVLIIAVGISIAALLCRGCPIPRHLFILGLVAKLSRSEAEQASASKLWREMPDSQYAAAP